MKKFFLVSSAIFCLLAIGALAFAQGTREWDKNGKAPLETFTPASITKYSNAAGTTKILIPMEKTVVRFCITPTAASQMRLGTTGDPKALAANVEVCRGVKKGITQIQYSSATTGTAIVEKEY